MANKKLDTTADWNLYEIGIEYNHSLDPDYYATTNRNWRVYNNAHWNGVKTGGLPVFILPMFQRIVRHFTASVMANNVKMQYTVENVSDDTADPQEMDMRQLADFLGKNSGDRWEQLKMDSLMRRILLDGAMSGDMATHTYWDETIDTGQTSGLQPVLDKDGSPTFDEMGMPALAPVPILGEFTTEAVDGCNVMFGNPNDNRVNLNGRPKQPYIIVAGRDMVSNLRSEAKRYRKENSLTNDEIENLISPDEDNKEQAGDRGSKELNNRESAYGKATYIIKYWYEDGKIYFNKSTKNAFIRKKVDTELSIYPVAWANWDSTKNSYHGQAVATGLVSNQLEIDKAFAKLFKWLGDMAFPKIAYNKNVLPNGITNKIGEAIAVDVNDTTSLSNVIYSIPPSNIANFVIQIIQLAITQTQELLGVSDAALGNANPENTSAIIALTQNSNIPLENVRANLYQLVEDIGYIWLDFMLRKYKVPRKMVVNSDGVRQMVVFDPALAQKAKFRIKIDVGAGSVWSEMSNIQTLDNLFRSGIVDAVQLLKRYPDGIIPDKDKLIEELELKLQQQQMMQTEQYKMQVLDEFLAQNQPQQTQ